MRLARLAVAATSIALPVAAAAAELPRDIAATGETIVLRAHAEGAQIYQCKADAGGKLTWQFREPIATLLVDGETVGRHFAGPTWEIGASAVVGKVVAHVPGSTPDDIPWLKLDVTEHRGEGPLREVTTVQRVDTAGGTVQGSCGRAGDLRTAPYAADYVFLKR